MANTRSRKAKSRKQPLTRERVVRAAVAIADKKGVHGLTMRKLASKLRVEAMSLYHHVANKEALLDGMVDLVFEEVVVPADKPWKEAMGERARSLRDALLRHPWAPPLLDSRRTPGFATLRHHDAVIGCLRRDGFSWPLVATALSLQDSYIYGFALQQISMPFESSEEMGEIADDILASLPVDALPNFVGLVTEHAMRPGYEPAAEFDVGLELVLDGLERRHREG